MHARSLLDFLSDADRAEKAERHDMRDWAVILQRLEDLERRLGDLRTASERREESPPLLEHDHRDLRDEISSILRLRGVAPRARRASPPPPLAPRDWVDPPPLSPLQAFQAPAERSDPDLLKFIEAVRLLGRAADRFMAAPPGQAPEHDNRVARSPDHAALPQGRPQARARPRPGQHSHDHAAPRADARASDADLMRLWDEVEHLRQTLAQLSPRRDSE
jgi:hypothetical protein